MTAETRFWEHKSLLEMTRTEWESLCDGCGKCCLLKLEDEDSGECHTTRLACRHLDRRNCRCDCYRERSERVPECVTLTPYEIERLQWMPQTCAYRLLAEGKSLPAWHPLISGDPDSVHRAGVSVRGRCLSEDHVHPDEWQQHIVHWVE